MYIKSYCTNRFAGLKDKKFNFINGLNVVLGDNESGKSTMICGIKSTLFKGVKHDRRSKDDREFRSSFMPVRGGDTIDGCVEIASGDDVCTLSKKWHEERNGEVELKGSDDSVLHDEKAVDGVLNDMLMFGEGTYANIVFAGQNELKSVLSHIMDDRNISHEINNVLRKTVMNLDGISIDDIEERIEAKYSSLYKKWDIRRNYPENNRGINNPYKKDLGKIVSAFYVKEQLKLDLDETVSAENRYDEIVTELKKLKTEYEEVRARLEFLQSLDEDMTDRSIKDARRENLKNQYETLKKINEEWPNILLLTEICKKEIASLESDRVKLKEELKVASNVSKVRDIRAKIEKIVAVSDLITQRKSILSSMVDVTKEDVENLRNLENEINSICTALKAGRITAEVLKSPLPVTVTTSDSTERINSGATCESDGYIRIVYGDDFEMTVKSAEIDFDSLVSKKKNLTEKIDSILSKFCCESVDEVKEKYGEVKRVKSELADLEKELLVHTREKSLDDYKAELHNFVDVVDVRNEELIERDLSALEQTLLKKMSEVSLYESKNDKWCKEYDDTDSLLDVLLEKRGELKCVNKELEKLQPLPEEFDSVDDFKIELKCLKTKCAEMSVSLHELEVEKAHREENLKEESGEDVKRRYLESCKVFEESLAEGETICRVRSVFATMKDDMMENPMVPLVKDFEENIQILTSGKYGSSVVDENLAVKLISDGAELTVDMLSAGTYDTVALALRFALLKYIFGDDGGFVILDDCLVDMDLSRKEMAIRLIKKMSEKGQIIFTTYDKNLAEQLGGNLITM